MIWFGAALYVVVICALAVGAAYWLDRLLTRVRR